MEAPIIRIEHVSKQYRLGMIGSTTLREELQRLGSRLRHEEDPTAKIGRSAAGLQSGDTFWALRDVSLDVRKGETLGIIGRNGAGKSTLLKLLCRITAPTEGKISYNGRIASMLEVGTGFHSELTGRENIYLNGAILGMTRREIDSKIGQIIDFSECGPFIDTPVKRYSSGMVVKLGFAVAAFLDAEIMIMDEVLAVGDAAFQQKSLRRMRELAQQEGRTVLYVSHLLPTVSQLCSRCIVLEEGRIRFEGAADEAIRQYLSRENVTPPVIDYTKQPRTGTPRRYAVRLLRAALEGREHAVLRDDGPVLLRLDFACLEDCSGLCLRWELRTAEGRPAATSVLEDFASGKAGEERSVLLRYDLSPLSPGRYASTFTFYCRLPDGASVNLECVEGLSFEKESGPSGGLIWDAARWGNVRLPGPEVADRA